MEPPEDDQRVTGRGNTYNTIVDNSKHDSSKHHLGDNHYITNHHYPSKESSASPKRPQDRLQNHVSRGALHNSAERGPHAPKCFPETRIAVQQEIISWMKHGDRTQPEVKAPQQILWLSGPAGSGKTAIMGTIADECHKEGSLAAGFFFSSFGGSPDRCSKRLFITTLVYQLTQHEIIQGYSDEVSAALDRDPLIFTKDLQAQVDALILIPFRNVASRSDRRAWPQLFIVDGLDECKGDGGSMQGASGDSKGEVHREILSVLVRVSNDPAFPFRIIIASRPERAIEGYFSLLPLGATKKVFLDSKYSPEADMELYARAMLNHIGMECGLVERWYSNAGQALGIEDVPFYWAKEASEQFVYVATVIRYVKSGLGTPHDRLERVLNWRQSKSSNPFAALDAIYTGILRTSPEPILAVKWINTVLTYDNHEEIPWYLSALLETSPGQTGYLLGPLSSLIRTVREDGEPDFHSYHKSLSDFLEDPQRSGELYVPDNQANAFQSGRYSAVLKNRGPLVSLPANYTMDAFMVKFRYYVTSTRVFPPSYSHHHDANDINWWLGLHKLEDDAPAGVLEAFGQAHEKCRWFACRPACKIWRKGILRFALANRWRVPTMLETLQDRFKPIPLVYEDPRKIALREILGPPEVTSEWREHRLRHLE